MASFLGALGENLGGTLKEIGLQKREERLAEEEFDRETQREMQLAKQRMAHDADLTQRTIDAQDRRTQRRNEFEMDLAEQEQTWATEAAETAAEREREKYEYEGQVDLATAAMNAWTQQQKDGVGRGNGWTTYSETVPSANGMGFEQAFFATRDGITYRQHGDKYTMAGQTEAPVAWNNTPEGIAARRDAESRLFSGEFTAQGFYDAFKYLPASYVTGQVAQGSDLGTFMRQQGIDFSRGGSGRTPQTVKPLTGEVADIVSQSSAEYGVPEALIRTVMDVESLGTEDRAKATSTAGARGYMQLMPDTAASLGVTDITDPGQNIPAGTAYLAQMMDKYDGNVGLALAAYNAGPTRVDRALEGGSNWMARLPSETKQYIAKAMSRYYALTQGGNVGALGTAAIQETEAPAPEVAPEAAPTEEVGPPAPEAAPAPAPEAPSPVMPGGPPRQSLSDADVMDIVNAIRVPTGSAEDMERYRREVETTYGMDPDAGGIQTDLPFFRKIFPKRGEEQTGQ